VQCFFHDGAGFDGAPAAPPAFPLFNRAASLAHDREPLVRAATRALLLRVYAIDDAAVQAYVASEDGGGMAVAALASAVADGASALRARLGRDDAAGGGGAALENTARELEDGLAFACDVLHTRVGRGSGNGGGVGGDRAAADDSSAGRPPAVARLLSDALWTDAFVPAVLEPLAALAAGAGDLASATGSPPPPPHPTVALGARAALHVAQLALHAAPDPDIAGALAEALLLGRARPARAARARTGRRAPSPPRPSTPPAAIETLAAAGLLAALRSPDAGLASAAALTVAAAAAAGREADAALAGAGLLPPARKRQADLLGELTDGGGAAAPAWGAELAAALGRRALSPPAARAVGAVLVATCADGAPDAAVAAGVATFAASARISLAEAVGGPWADALPCLAAAEWPACRAVVTTPPRHLPTPLAVAAWRTPASDADAERAARASSDRPPAAAAPPSAPAALAAARAVQAAVLATQLEATLAGRGVAAEAPAGVAGAAPPAPPPDGAPARLAPSIAVPCTVAFARGQERRVLLALAGAPPAAVLADARAATPGAPPPRSAPILSSAPLLGAAASPDARHPRWLHVAVRPPAAGLARAVAAGGGGRALAAALVDGHWVLAFDDGESAAAAAAALAAAGEGARAAVAAGLQGLGVVEVGSAAAAAVANMTLFSP